MKCVVLLLDVITIISFGHNLQVVSLRMKCSKQKSQNKTINKNPFTLMMPFQKRKILFGKKWLYNVLVKHTKRTNMVQNITSLGQ